MNFKDVQEQEVLEFKSVENETYRLYIYKNGFTIKVDNPVAIHISRSGGHRLILASGRCMYVKAGWIAFAYEKAKDDEGPLWEW